MVAVAVCFKNEEEVLPFTIPTWKLFADQIVYLDTGSTDSSLDLAIESARLCDVVRQVPWKDFSTAINQSMDLAQERWAIRMDADELLVGNPEEFAKWLEWIDSDPKHQEVAPSILLALYEFHDEKWVLVNWRARMFVWSNGWKFRFPIDPQPVPPEGVPYGLLCPETLCRVYHLRESTREESLIRNECYVWKRILEDEPLSDEEIAHYEVVLETCNLGREEP